MGPFLSTRSYEDVRTLSGARKSQVDRLLKDTSDSLNDPVRCHAIQYQIASESICAGKGGASVTPCDAQPQVEKGRTSLRPR